MSKKEKNAQILKKLDENKLRSYCNFFQKHNLQEFHVDEDGLEINLKSKNPITFPPPRDNLDILNPISSPTTQSNTKKIEKTLDKDDIKKITAPTAGIFYSATSPDSDPFVKMGSKVKKGHKVCIIEAMKIMNEIESPESGIIKKILVKNGETVTNGQVLMYLE